MLQQARMHMERQHIENCRQQHDSAGDEHYREDRCDSYTGGEGITLHSCLSFCYGLRCAGSLIWRSSRASALWAPDTLIRGWPSSVN